MIIRNLQKHRKNSFFIAKIVIHLVWKQHSQSILSLQDEDCTGFEAVPNRDGRYQLALDKFLHALYRGGATIPQEA
jgi:hypothetical protein